MHFATSYDKTMQFAIELPGGDFHLLQPLGLGLGTQVCKRAHASCSAALAAQPGPVRTPLPSSPGPRTQP
jgi:hypothetical protein